MHKWRAAALDYNLFTHFNTKSHEAANAFFNIIIIVVPRFGQFCELRLMGPKKVGAKANSRKKATETESEQ